MIYMGEILVSDALKLDVNDGLPLITCDAADDDVFHENRNVCMYQAAQIFLCTRCFGYHWSY